MKTKTEDVLVPIMAICGGLICVLVMSSFVVLIDNIVTKGTHAEQLAIEGAECELAGFDWEIRDNVVFCIRNTR